MTLPDIQQQLDALRRAGTHQFDPAGFHYMEALARRGEGQSEKVQGLLETRLATALADWNRRQAQAPTDRATAPTNGPSPLSELLRYLALHAQESDERNDATRTELKSVRNFRNTWSKLSADKQVKKSMDQAPKNAGPLNSHLLVLRSLGQMRDISPDYLNRFVSYADTLLCLALREIEPSKPVAASAGPGPLKKTRPRRKPAAD